MTTLVTERPASAATPSWRFPEVSRVSLPGVTVVAAHLAARPLVHATVLVGDGAIADPDGREGLAAALGDVVLRGAAGRDQHALAVAFERVGAVPGVSTRYERTELSLEAPTGLLPGAIALLADVLRRPTLADEEVDRVRAARVDRIRARATDAGARASRAASAALFGTRSRFSLPSSGDVDPLLRLTADEVVAQHEARWRAAPVTLVLVGDLGGLDLEDVAGPLRVDADPAPAVVASDDLKEPGRRLVTADVPGAVQSMLRAVAPGPRFGEGDDAALEVGQTALFGSFSSRLNLRLREELGYTYGARGGFTRLRDAGWATIGCSVRTEVTADAVAELVGVVRGVLAGGLEDGEVTQARENLVRRFPVRYDGPAAVAGALVRRVHRGLPDDERDEHLAALRAVTTDAASAALEAALDLDDLVVVVAGASEQVTPSLADLGLGPVVPEPSPPAAA